MCCSDACEFMFIWFVCVCVCVRVCQQRFIAETYPIFICVIVFLQIVFIIAFLLGYFICTYFPHYFCKVHRALVR